MRSTVSTPVWDLSIRAFHWTLVASVLFCWLSAELGGDWMIWHMRSGYLITGLVTFRVLWGLIGTWSARFSSFLKPPTQVISYLKDKGEQHHLTHNPAGAWGVIALLILIALQVGTGLFSNDDIFLTGPLADLISYDAQIQATSLHKTIFNILLAMITLHIAAIIFHQFIKREPLIQAMLHGKKPAPENKTRPLAFPKGAFVISLTLSGALFYWLWSIG